MFRVNGLFGWIEQNDRRSLLLFAGFLAVFHVGAAMTLLVPLASLDPDHAPVFGWTGYLTRYVPLATVAAVAVFAIQMAWHVRTVRRLVAFEFVDDRDEPRLCRIVEPLAIAMGLPAPYVGVIETPALNAFACGLRRADAVVVVTRGLLDGLDDEELAAVVAHELAHIANGDIRLMAAAGVCLNVAGLLLRPRKRQANAVVEIVSLPVATFFMPPVLLFVLIACALAQTAMAGGRLARRLISASREFIADARAVEATQNPAALVSALRRIAGRSRIAEMSPGQDAMMIDGETDGAFATHPGIDERIRAIAEVTGSMSVIAPARRDTRSEQQRRRDSFGSGRAALFEAAPDPDRRDWLGLTQNMTIGAALAVGVFIGAHHRDIGDPRALASALDPRPLVAAFAVNGRGVACGLTQIVTGPKQPGADGACAAATMDDAVARRAKMPGPVGAMMETMQKDGGVFRINGRGPKAQ